MNGSEINAEIRRLRDTLKGDLLDDMETHQKIYELKKILNPDIVANPQLDEDECISCGS
jgi:hypothetical protein